MNIIKAINLIQNDSFKKAFQYVGTIRQPRRGGFNLIELISDYYYRENFYSDIFAALLNPKSSHLENDLFLVLFLDLLNRIKAGEKIDKTNYINSIVVREEKRIDILIKGGRHAVIIENKINDAVDQPGQLVRYYNSMVQDGYEVDAIVYLTKDGNKTPSMEGWTDVDNSIIRSKLVNIAAYDILNLNDLVKGWLFPCQLYAKNMDAICVLRSLIDIITKNGEIMYEFKNFESLYRDLLVETTFEDVLKLTEFVSTQLAYQVSYEIIKHFEEDPLPFGSIHRAENTAVFTNWYFENVHVIMQCSFYFNKQKTERFDVRIFAQNKNQNQSLLPKSIIDKIPDFVENNGLGYYRYYEFPEDLRLNEDGTCKVYNDLKDILSRFKSLDVLQDSK